MSEKNELNQLKVSSEPQSKASKIKPNSFALNRDNNNNSAISVADDDDDDDDFQPSTPIKNNPSSAHLKFQLRRSPRNKTASKVRHGGTQPKPIPDPPKIKSRKRKQSSTSKHNVKNTNHKAKSNVNNDRHKARFHGVALSLESVLKQRKTVKKQTQSPQDDDAEYGEDEEMERKSETIEIETKSAFEVKQGETLQKTQQQHTGSQERSQSKQQTYQKDNKNDTIDSKNTSKTTSKVTHNTSTSARAHKTKRRHLGLVHARPLTQFINLASMSESHSSQQAREDELYDIHNAPTQWDPERKLANERNGELFLRCIV